MDVKFAASFLPAAGTLIVEGDVDTSSAPELYGAMKAAAPTDGRALVVDLTRVMYLDSSAIAALCDFLVSHDLEIHVTADSAVDTTMRITGLHRLARLHRVQQS